MRESILPPRETSDLPLSAPMEKERKKEEEERQG